MTRILETQGRLLETAELGQRTIAIANQADERTRSLCALGRFMETILNKHEVFRLKLPPGVPPDVRSMLAKGAKEDLKPVEQGKRRTKSGNGRG